MAKRSADDMMWLDIARQVAGVLGTCARRNVGAVLLSQGRVREVGWNGMERAEDAPTCYSGACPRGRLTFAEQPAGVGYSNCIYLHAEFNALEHFRIAMGASNKEDWALPFRVQVYSSSHPCDDCATYAKWAGADLIWEDDE